MPFFYFYVVDNRRIKVIGGRGEYTSILCWRGDIGDARAQYKDPDKNYGFEEEFI